MYALIGLAVSITIWAIWLGIKILRSNRLDLSIGNFYLNGYGTLIYITSKTDNSNPYHQFYGPIYQSSWGSYYLSNGTVKGTKGRKYNLVEKIHVPDFLIEYLQSELKKTGDESVD